MTHKRLYFYTAMLWLILGLLWSLNMIDIWALNIIGGLGTLVALHQHADFTGNGSLSVRAQALNNIPTPMIILSSNLQCNFANSYADQIFGRNINGEDISHHLHQGDIMDVIRMVVSNGETHKRTLRYTAADDRHFDLSVLPIPDTGNIGDGKAIIFFYEVTRLLKTEAMRVDFVANASHELRTPLSSILGFVETLQGPAKGDEQASTRFLGIIQSEAERMTRLVDDLLSLSHIELERHVEPNAAVHILSLINSAVEALIDKAKKRGIEFSIEISDDMPTVNADSDQITQVMMNLMSNAAKYADSDSTVHVGAVQSKPGGKIQLFVRDEGPGIASEHLGRMTERFYRVDTARSRKMGGTGLGLAIVKHILLRHRSQLKIDSTVGKGTKFSFLLDQFKSK